jgi:hypothetical protein
MTAFTDKQNIKYFLATPWKISATHKCVATPGFRTTAVELKLSFEFNPSMFDLNLE